MIEVKATPKFMRLAKKAMPDDALQGLIDLLALHPEQGPVIKDTGGIRKLRWRTGKGGGKYETLRILYYYNSQELVFLLMLFKKTDQENIDAGEKAALRKLMKELFGDKDD